ncbi:hypothetical protein diail_4489 [Diaporthe ilicicola]|nr:hypothetical protein diail_4489 [Diaporthe ilicicola]
MDSKLATLGYSILQEKGALAAVVLASVLAYYATTTYLAWRRLRHFPGPLLASITNLWGLFTILGGQHHIQLSMLQKKYGKAMRIGPDAIMIYDPETLWHINSARSSYTRGGWYESHKFHPEGDSILSEMSTVLHDKRKAKLTSGFAGKGSVRLEADVDSQIAALIRLIRAKVRNGQGNSIAFSKIIRWFQLDLITLAGLGKAWGNLTDETDHFGFLATMDVAMPLIHSICLVPFMRKIIFSKLFLYMAAPKVTDKEGMGSSIRLKQEIAEGIKAGRISQPITNDQAKEMPYLQAVISEGMRIVPPVINGVPKEVPPGGDTICGKFVPEGTEVHLNFTAMLMNTEVFGADAEVFRPERFLECDAKQKAYMLKTIDLTFGYGRWLCLGRPLALIELNKIFVELLRVFDFQISNAEQPWRRRVYSASIISDFGLRVWENPLD